MKSKVSIIIPVYNVANYLQQCLNSVENQDYPFLEVIIVNDGSTDMSKLICEQYVDRHPSSWKLINQVNSGLSAARNAGLAIATGKYIAFLDSDDWIDNDFISSLVLFKEKTGCQIVESGIRWCYPNETRNDSVKDSCVYDMREALSHYLLQSDAIHSAVWCKLYDREIFSELNFEVGRLHEDGYFTYRAMYKCQKYGLVNYVGYNYRQDRIGSIMSTTVKPKNIIDVLDMMEERIVFFANNKEFILAEQASSYYFRTLLTNYVTAKNTIKDEALCRNIISKLYSNKKSIFKNRYLGIKKLKFVCFFYFPNIFNQRY